VWGPEKRGRNNVIVGKEVLRAVQKEGREARLNRIAEKILNGRSSERKLLIWQKGLTKDFYSLTDLSFVIKYTIK